MIGGIKPDWKLLRKNTHTRLPCQRLSLSMMMLMMMGLLMDCKEDRKGCRCRPSQAGKKTPPPAVPQKIFRRVCDVTHTHSRTAAATEIFVLKFFFLESSWVRLRAAKWCRLNEARRMRERVRVSVCVTQSGSPMIKWRLEGRKENERERDVKLRWRKGKRKWKKKREREHGRNSVRVSTAAACYMCRERCRNVGDWIR